MTIMAVRGLLFLLISLILMGTPRGSIDRVRCERGCERAVQTSIETLPSDATSHSIGVQFWTWSVIPRSPCKKL